VENKYGRDITSISLFFYQAKHTPAAAALVATAAIIKQPSITIKDTPYKNTQHHHHTINIKIQNITANQ
jgi:hypothetical protein